MIKLSSIIEIYGNLLCCKKKKIGFGIHFFVSPLEKCPKLATDLNIRT